MYDAEKETYQLMSVAIKVNKYSQYFKGFWRN